MSTLLGVQPTALVVARDFALPPGPLPLDALARYPWVPSQDGCGMRSALSRAFSAAGLPFDVAVEAFGSDLQLSLVARGAALGVASAAALARSPHRGALRVVETEDVEPGVNVWLVRGVLPGRLMRPVELLRERLGAVLEEERSRRWGGEATMPAN